MNTLMLVKGAGDLATGVAHRLHRSGFPRSDNAVA